MKKLFWILFYKIFYGKSYKNRLDEAAKLYKGINASSRGGVRYKFNEAGQPLRENHSPILLKKELFAHPLIAKYPF